MQESDGKDSLSKLIEDVERAAVARACACRYLGKQEDDKCDGCPGRGTRCYEFVFNDLARRLHTLMPHDKDGREIKTGDTFENFMLSRYVATGTRVILLASHDGREESSNAFMNAHLLHVVQPDSWERLEEDAAMHPHDYLTVKDTSDKRYGTEAMNAMAADLVRRAKALAGVEQ